MFVFVYPMLLDAAGGTDAVARAAAMGGLAGGIVSAVLSSVLPLATLVALVRPSVKAQLAS
jgi:hypothetical protein